MALFRVTIFGTLYGNLINNVLHFQKPDIVAEDMGWLAQRVSEKWVGFVVLNLPEKVGYNRIKIERVDADPAPPPVELSINANGNFFAGELFPFSSVVLQLRTAIGGRKGRGRHFLPYGYTDLTGGFWNAQTMTRFNDLCGTLKSWWVQGGSNINAQHGPYDLCVAPRTDPSLFIPVNDIIPRSWPGTQVRRNFYRGA